MKRVEVNYRAFCLSYYFIQLIFLQLLKQFDIFLKNNQLNLQTRMSWMSRRQFLQDVQYPLLG